MPLKEQEISSDYLQGLYLKAISGKLGALKSAQELTKCANGRNKEAEKLLKLFHQAIEDGEIAYPTQ